MSINGSNQNLSKAQRAVCGRAFHAGVKLRSQIMFGLVLGLELFLLAPVFWVKLDRFTFVMQAKMPNHIDLELDIFKKFFEWVLSDYWHCLEIF
jgi:hypothetical protein